MAQLIICVQRNNNYLEWPMIQSHPILMSIGVWLLNGVKLFTIWIMQKSCHSVLQPSVTYFCCDSQMLILSLFLSSKLQRYSIKHTWKASMERIQLIMFSRSDLKNVMLHFFANFHTVWWHLQWLLASATRPEISLFYIYSKIRYSEDLREN